MELKLLFTPQDLARQYEIRGAFFSHDGTPNCPHPVLTSPDAEGLERHAGHYINSPMALRDASLLEQIAMDLGEMLSFLTAEFDQVDQVIGLANGATNLSTVLGIAITHRRARACLVGHTTKVGEGLNKRIIWNGPSFRKGEERIIPVEDVLSTGGSLALAAQAVEENGALVLPCVIAPINQSGKREINGSRILSILNLKPIQTWPKDKCPFCQMGSEAICHPKKNWDRLTTRTHALKA
ncbi:MAG: hypothetical protein AAB758_00955 [Patescibacteria group bacterium]